MEKQQIFQNAVRALLYEAVINPKPGLVDPVTHGSHPDMDIFTFINSSMSLENYFKKCVELAQQSRQKCESLDRLFLRIREEGVRAEKQMFKATVGINTHKGAIFALGIMVTAVAYQNKQNVNVIDLQLLKRSIKEMMIHILDDFEQLQSKDRDDLTAGEKQYLDYGLTGIRGEAANGFSIVIDKALPFMQKTQGSRKQRMLDTLMYIAGNIQDSTLIKRAKTINAVNEVKQDVEKYFALGGSQNITGIEYLKELDAKYAEKHYSLGGTADILILTIYLGLLNRII
ncbi:MAG: triphosphoribosyl-dephospho-CoA synthase CitG [Firmicutes bacterium]|uniref:Probable 2-(5''-triphosphoribosyl)-3'-dephosphocoenzyme-A synthase n=1 Tax=Candidatus Gallilactobacillus intestinavium TaxID=2840838 RepID=A0A9D9E6N2_9LACO|nr:triphosphoribosyl-dephospho-CoA synthase CitG [Candidatus Gallilactobacillus intestinavium]